VLFVEGAGVLLSPVGTTPPSEPAGQDFTGGRCGHRCTERAPKVAHSLADRCSGAVLRVARGDRAGGSGQPTSAPPDPGRAGPGRTQDLPCPVPVYSAPDTEDVVDTIHVPHGTQDTAQMRGVGPL